MSSDFGLEDDTLIDLFRSEVETHSESLSNALLALERSPSDTSRIDEMMRAAHSIKGASRVVGVDPAVSVAHVMEDCFVAAQTGTIAFSPLDVDVLLRGVDLLCKISAATRDPKVNLANEFSDPVKLLVAELHSVLNGTNKPKEEPAEAKQAAVIVSEAKLEPAPIHLSAPGTRGITVLFPEILDFAAAEGIRGQLLAAIDARCQTIRFDLLATKDLDVQGLAFLAAVPAFLAQSGRPPLELAGVSLEMATVLRVTGLAGPFGVRSDLAGKAE